MNAVPLVFQMHSAEPNRHYRLINSALPTSRFQREFQSQLPGHRRCYSAMFYHPISSINRLLAEPRFVVCLVVRTQHHRHAVQRCLSRAVGVLSCITRWFQSRLSLAQNQLDRQPWDEEENKHEKLEQPQATVNDQVQLMRCQPKHLSMNLVNNLAG